MKNLEKTMEGTTAATETSKGTKEENECNTRASFSLFELTKVVKLKIKRSGGRNSGMM